MSTTAFRANIEDVTGNAALGAETDLQHVHSKEMNEHASAKEQEELLGLPGGSVLSVSGRANSDAQTKTAKQLAERQSSAERAANDVALWVALMQQGELDAFIAENVVAGASDEELAKL